MSGTSNADSVTVQALWSRFAAASGDQEFYESWLALLAAQLAPTRRAVLVLGSSGSGGRIEVQGEIRLKFG